MSYIESKTSENTYESKYATGMSGCLDIPNGSEWFACVKQHISNIKIAATSKENLEAHIYQQDFMHLFELHRLIVH